MNLIPRLTLFLILLLSASSAFSQYDKKYTIAQDSFPSGKIKSVKEVWTKYYKKPDPGDQTTFFSRRKERTVEYFESGKTKSITESIFRSSSFGKACGTEYERREWYATGKRKYYENRRCNDHHNIIKEYDKKGRLKKKTKVVQPYRTNQ